MNGVNGKQHRWFALHIAPLRGFQCWTDGEKQRKFNYSVFASMLL